MPSGGGFSRILRDTALFAGLDEGELNLLALRCGARQYAQAELLFSEGEPCKGLFIVISGRVRIFKIAPNGREQVLSVEAPGATVAELPVFDGGNYPASASAMQPTEMLFL